MRIETLSVRGHGLSVDIDLGRAPLTVVVGENDSGKSTLLGAARQALAGPHGVDRRVVLGDRYHELEERRIGIVVELDGLGLPGHPDERFFVQLLQYGRVWLDATPAPSDAKSWLVPLVYRADDEPFVEFPREPLSSDVIGRELSQGVLHDIGRRQPWNEEVMGAWTTVLDACFSSRRFWIGEQGASWLCPLVSSVPTHVREIVAVLLEPSSSGERPVDALEFIGPGTRAFFDSLAGGESLDLGAHFGLWDEEFSGVKSWIESLGDGEERHETIFGFSTLQTLRMELWDVVQVTDEVDALQELETRVEDFLRVMLPRPSRQIGSRRELAKAIFEDKLLTRSGRERSEPDIWLEQGRSGWFRLNPAVSALCDRLGREATELAPPFVREKYEILVDPLSPDRWGAENRRVAISLSRSLESEERFELSSVGRGVAIWASYALIEAMRRLRAEGGEHRQQIELPAELELTGEEEAKFRRRAEADLVQQVWYPIDPAQRQTVYLFDEPERHLHPIAQEQVAKWIEAAASGSGTTLVATHAPPLLQIPSDRAEFVWLNRGENDLSRAVAITEDLLGTLMKAAEQIGFSPSEAIVRTRAWLIVEGAHDQKIVERFFGRELKRARVQILALRGAEGVLQTLELEYLSRLGKPLFLLLDNVSEAWIIDPEGSGIVPKREEQLVDQVRRLWDNPAVTLTPLGYPRPDIICSLPTAAVQALLDERESGAQTQFPGWEELVAAHANTGKEGGFKSFAFRSLKLPPDRAYADEFLDEVLGRSDVADSDPVLRRAIQTMLARLEVAPDL